MPVQDSHIKGVIPILPTPFQPDQSIDESGVESIIFFAKKAGCTIAGLPAFGSEYYKLTNDERSRILDIVFANAGDLKIVVQCNHTSPNVVAGLVKDAENRGAIAVSSALPRMMAVSESELYQYATTVCRNTSLPVILQDFNPGGSVIGLDFVKKLSDEFENFYFIKYELPGVGTVINEILRATDNKVKVISGWGASYMLEQLPAGIAGIMPGIPLADYFIKLWNEAAGGNMTTAIEMFSLISPYLSFSLQNLEMFHHVEKRLSVRRGIFKFPCVRSVTITLDPYQERYLDLVIDQSCRAIKKFGLPERY